MVIVDETYLGQRLRLHFCPLPNILITMSSLIEGWFQLMNGHPFVDDLPDATTTPQKTRSYLSVYNSCATLGPISSEDFVQCELHLFPGNHLLDDKVVHVHGQFSIIASADEDQPHKLQIEVHRFVITNMNPTDKATPDDLYTSVTLSGVQPADQAGTRYCHLTCCQSKGLSPDTSSVSLDCQGFSQCSQCFLFPLSPLLLCFSPFHDVISPPLFHHL